MQVRWALVLALLLAGQAALAEPVFTGRVSLTGLLYTEDDGVAVAEAPDPLEAVQKKNATTAWLGYGELRGLLEGKRLWKDRIDLRFDMRLRLTGSFDFERKFDRESESAQALSDEYDKNPATSPGTSSRGYLGGPEYDLREAYVLWRVNDRYTLQAGRMFVRAADGAKIDGLRAIRGFGEHWEGGLFLGGYPNPYSRSLTSDYEPPCGPGVTGARVMSETAPFPNDPNLLKCQTEGPKLGFAVGMTARYNYASLWGSIGLTGTLFAGAGDGGVVTPLDAPDTRSISLLQAHDDRLDRPRIYLSFTNSWRPLERLDLFADVVFDFYGGTGLPQVTRVVTLGTLRLLRDDRLTLRLGYSHLSSLAINMYLNRLLYNRRSGATLSLAELSFAQNNLTVLRTGRDEVRATFDFRILSKLGVFLDVRFRHRNLIGGDTDPGTYRTPSKVYDDNTMNLSGDASVGVRDLGSLAAIRAGLSYTALFTFRGQNHVVNLDFGRDFFKERLGADLNYVLVITRDNGAAVDPASPQAACAPTNPFVPSCYGRRTGMTHELGLTLTANPWSRIFLFLDYRFIALLTDPQNPDPTSADNTAKVDIPTILSHGILLRAEYRW